MAQEPVVVRVARQFRDELARNEDAALKRMARSWLQMEDALEREFLSLYADVRELYDSGQPVPQQYIYTLNRYQKMIAQVQRELPYYQATIEDLIEEYQRKDFILGLDSANAIIQATDPSAEIWNRINKDAAEVMVGFAGNGAPLAQLLRTDYGELGASITDALISGVTLGKGAYQTARDMRSAVEALTYTRSVRIARTEINRAYRIANAEQYAASGVVTKVIRLCYPPTACFACLEMDGEECPNGICDDHPNGKCTTIVETVGGVRPTWQTGHEWLMEQSEEDQRRIMGVGRYEMWKKDGVPLRDMVKMQPNPVWGGSPTIISERELRAKLEGLE